MTICEFPSHCATLFSPLSSLTNSIVLDQIKLTNEGSVNTSQLAEKSDDPNKLSKIPAAKNTRIRSIQITYLAVCRLNSR